MKSNLINLVFVGCVCATLASKFEEPLLYEKFPPSFMWATGSSAYQVEGAWNDDGTRHFLSLQFSVNTISQHHHFFKGKGLSIWDTFTANVSAVTQGANGKVACDSYHLYQKDVDLLKSLNVSCPLHFLKFSFTP